MLRHEVKRQIAATSGLINATCLRTWLKDDVMTCKPFHVRLSLHVMRSPKLAAAHGTGTWTCGCGVGRNEASGREVTHHDGGAGLELGAVRPPRLPAAVRGILVLLLSWRT